ncbi:Conserved_hypothetical protein [Hexamita inflata]|uniref:Myb-like domain-containing protein n=2 Tax=Hexamita inflata TaxID=28002 RepID=A0AA86P7Q1_9EUKA|nr:Conserved hypothetical protein [Hexamita inflata]
MTACYDCIILYHSFVVETYNRSLRRPCYNINIIHNVIILWNLTVITRYSLFNLKSEIVKLIVYSFYITTGLFQEQFLVKIQKFQIYKDYNIIKVVRITGIHRRATTTGQYKYQYFCIFQFSFNNTIWKTFKNCVITLLVYQYRQYKFPPQHHYQMDNTNQITYHKWTDEELAKVQRGITEYGHRWRLIQQNLLPHLPIQTIKNKFYSIEYKRDQGKESQRVTGKMTPPLSAQENLSSDQEQIIKKLGELLGLQI